MAESGGTIEPSHVLAPHVRRLGIDALEHEI